MFLDLLAANRQELRMNCSQLICTSESGEATSTRAVASLVQKMSPPQLYKRGLALINKLTLTTEMSFGSIGQQALIDVRRQVSLAGFRRPSHLFLLSRHPELAALLQVLALV